MSPTDQIAKLLGISGPQAVAYCEQVRRLSSLGPKLYYQLIYNQLKLEKPPYPEAAALAKKIRLMQHGQKNVPVSQKNLALKNTPKITQPEPQEKISIYEHHEVIASLPDSEPFVPSHLPKNVERYSYNNHERVSQEKLSHCKHGVPVGQLCAICDQAEFRRMTGID